MEPQTDPATTRNRAQVLAQSLDYLTVEDVCALYEITPSTAENWRKRRKGPAYVLAGTRYLYPRSAVAADLQARVRVGSAVTGKATL